MSTWFWFLIAILAVAVILVWRQLQNIGEKYNVADWGSPSLNRLDGINRWYCRRFHRLKSDPVPLPDQGGAVMVANHISGLDPLLMIAACERPLRFIIAEEEYNRWLLGGLFEKIGCIPVNRKQRPDKAFYAARKALSDGEVVALFPEGGIHRANAQRPKLKRGATYLASITDSPVIALRIEGVSGDGFKLLALFLRSVARIFCSDVFTCERETEKELIARIASHIQANSTST